MTSSKPAVVNSATGAPRPSSRAFVATVVPWASTSGRGTPTARQASTTARAGSAGDDRTLVARPVALTTSVNVPPASVPTRPAEATGPTAPDVPADSASVGTPRLDATAPLSP